MTRITQAQAQATTLGYAQITSLVSNSGGPTQVAGLSVTVTIPAGGRRVKITAWTGDLSNANGGAYGTMTIWDGTVGSGTQLARGRTWMDTAASGGGRSNTVVCQAVVTPTAGSSKTYNVGLAAEGGGTATIACDATSPAFILVELI